MFTLAQLQPQGKDLDLRLKNFQADFEDNPRLSEKQKEAAFKTLQEDYDTWKKNMARHPDDAAVNKLKKFGVDAGFS